MLRRAFLSLLVLAACSSAAAQSALITDTENGPVHVDLVNQGQFFLAAPDACLTNHYHGVNFDPMVPTRFVVAENGHVITDPEFLIGDSCGFGLLTFTIPELKVEFDPLLVGILALGGYSIPKPIVEEIEEDEERMREEWGKIARADPEFQERIRERLKKRGSGHESAPSDLEAVQESSGGEQAQDPDAEEDPEALTDPETGRPYGPGEQEAQDVRVILSDLRQTLTDADLPSKGDPRVKPLADPFIRLLDTVSNEIDNLRREGVHTNQLQLAVRAVYDTPRYDRVRGGHLETNYIGLAREQAQRDPAYRRHLDAEIDRARDAAAAGDPLAPKRVQVLEQLDKLFDPR